MKLLRAVVLSGIAAVLVARGAAAAPVQWYHFDPTCVTIPDHFLPPPGKSEVTELRCGGYGRFIFGAPGLGYKGQCTFKSGTEDPPLYPVEPMEDHPDLPCRNGSCLGHRPTPWIAAIDWNAPHGWTVAETVLQAADRRVAVELFDLANPQGLLPSWLLEVGDAHVLAQVCAVAERVANGSAAPLAINLSFGRLATVPNPCSTAARLECEIEGVLSHLRGFGTVPVAAAGNNGKLLFPAASAQVLAAGAMDLAWYQQTGNVQPSSETPAGTEALVPGYGLYLAPAQVGMEFWAAPAGTSYASALITGWIAGARTVSPSLPPPIIGPPGVWTPVRCGERYCLARNGQILPGSSGLSAPTALLQRAFGQQPAVCDVIPPLSYTVAVQGPAGGLPERTLPELVRELNCSQPGAHPCVPCHGGEPQGLLAAEGETDEVLVNLELSEGLPEEFEIHGLYLQAGDVVYSLDRSQDPVLRGALQHGTLRGLHIRGLASVMRPGDQLSLVYVLETRGLDFRESTPIHVHLH